MAKLAHSRDELEHFAARLEGLQVGSLKVRSARVEPITDSAGDVALRATLLVPEPVGDTWPVDAYFDLRREVNQIGAHLGFDEIVYVDLSAPSDLEDQSGSDGDPETDAVVDAAIIEQRQRGLFSSSCRSVAR